MEKRTLVTWFIGASLAYILYVRVTTPEAPVAISLPVQTPNTAQQSSTSTQRATEQTPPPSDTVSASTPPRVTTGSITTPSSSPSPKPAPKLSPAPVTPPRPKGVYTDGTYVGSPVDAYYGTVQVEASIQNGRLADVQFLQYPNDRQTSRYISSQAIPALTSEAIQAQSARVDIVSGATDTSQAFQQSLSDALQQARA